MLDVHGSNPGGLTIAAEDPQDREFAFARFRERLDITHALGGDSMVYHVPEQEFSDALLARYIEGLQRLEEAARNLGIVIALENHYKNENDGLKDWHWLPLRPGGVADWDAVVQGIAKSS